MENNLVRTVNILGNNKNVVGTNTADLVLEALGKVYVKTGKQTRILNDIFKLLDGIDGGNVGSKTIITNKIDTLKFPGDGFLVFDTKENALYISYDQRYLLVIDGIDKEVKDLGFVKKEGDTMFGPLKITHQGAPLIVASKELVKRFNANYLEGHDSEYFAAKSLDEFISGYWTFQQDTKFDENIVVEKNVNVGRDSLVGGNSVVSQDLTVKGSAEVYDVAQFRNNVKIEGDIVLDGSIGSQMFMSGYQGYGWRFDANTNMLTVDYLVVRKAMHVFELVVNKISATNGSLWVTDSAKIDSVYNVKTLPISDNSLDWVEENVWYVPYQTQYDSNGTTTDVYNRKKVVIDDRNIKRPEQYTTINGEIRFENNYYDIFKYICKYKPSQELKDRDAKNKENMDKIAVLFPESDLNTGELTHFVRDVGFGFPIDGEVPLYVYDNKPSFRVPISYTYYNEKGNAVGKDYNDQYAYIKANVFVEAEGSDLNNKANLYRFNSVTKKYIKYESSVPEYDNYKYKYIFKRDYLVKVLYSTEWTQEEATHFQPSNCDYFLEATPTHRKNDITPTYSFNEADNTYTQVVDGKYYYDSEAQMYKELERYIKALPPTHYYDANTGQYKESKYYDEDTKTTVDTGITPEYYLDLETNTYLKGASYVYDKNSGDYVLVGTPTHLLSNYRQAEGLIEATHVYVPESYYAPASNVYVATHKQQEIDGEVQWITQDEYSVLDTDIQINRVLNTNTTPRVIAVDRNLKSVTNSDIKQLYSLYKYFGIPANDDIWDNETVVNLDNVKIIKMKDDEYPPFKEGDILRCQKFENGNIKFYEAIVVCKIDAYSYVIIVAGSVFDIQTTVEYNEDGTVKEYKEELNKTLYSKTSQSEGSTEGTAVGKDGFDENSLISGPAAEDGLVRIGHLFDRDRQNSVYITSSEMDSPYIQTISGVNRPDYTVLYGEPNFITNDRGYYQFSTNSFKLIEGTSDMVEVNTPNGVLKLKCKDGKFYAPNNHYINQLGTITIAEYNPDSVKINTNARVRLGNLNGITDPMFGNKQPYGYGLFADNVFLKGEFYLNNGKTVVEFSKEQAAIESEKIVLKAVAKKDNLFYASDGDDYVEDLPNPNLLRNTNFDVPNSQGNMSYWESYQYNQIINNGFGKFKSLDFSGKTSEILKAKIPSTINKGDTFTVSFWAKGTPRQSAATKHFGFFITLPYIDLTKTSNGNGFGNVGGGKNTDAYFSPNEDWTLYWATFTFDPLADSIQSYASNSVKLCMYNWGYDGQVANIKVEKGAVPTAYQKNYIDYAEGDPGSYSKDFGKWFAVKGVLQKSTMVDSDGLNYIKGLCDENNQMEFITISSKSTKLAVNQSIYVQLNTLSNYGNGLKLSLFYISNNAVGQIGVSKPVGQGISQYEFGPFSGATGDYFLMLKLTNDSLCEVDFKTEVASENRIGVDATIQIENGEITQTIRNEFTGALNKTKEDITGTINTIQNGNNTKFATYEERLDEAESTIEDVNTGLSTVTQTVEGFEQRVESVEGDVSLVKQTSNEWSTQVGYSYVLFETPKLSIAKHNEWASLGGVDTWQAEASNYIKLFNKTETSEVYNALGSGVIEWRNGDSYIKAKSKQLILYFKPPYEIKKDTEIVIKLTTQDNLIQQFGFSISGVIRNSSGTALSNTVSHTLQEDEYSFELKLKLSQNIQDQQIYNLYITSPSMTQFYLKYPISTNLDVFEGSQIQVLKDNINISTKELILTNSKGSTKLLSEDKNMVYNVAGDLKTSVTLSGGYSLYTELKQITIRCLTPTQNNIDKYPFWTYYPTAKEIKDLQGNKYERRSNGYWYKVSTGQPVEIGQYSVSYNGTWYFRTKYNVYYDWYNYYSSNDAKLAHYIKVPSNRVINLLNDPNSTPPEPDSSTPPEPDSDSNGGYIYVSIYNISDFSNLPEVTLRDGFVDIQQLYWYDEEADEYKEPNYFCYQIKKLGTDSVQTYSALDLGVAGFEQAKKEYNGIITTSGNDIDGHIIDTLDGSYRDKVMALSDTYSYYLGCLKLPTNEIYSSITVSMKKTDSISSTTFSMSDAQDSCNPDNINYFKMLEKLRSSVTVTSHKPYVIYVVAFDHTKYEGGYPTFDVTYNLKLKDVKSESYILPDKLWLDAQSGAALMSYDKDNGLRLIFREKVVNFARDGISTQNYESKLVQKDSEYKSYYGGYLQIMEIQTTLSTTKKTILSW